MILSHQDHKTLSSKPGSLGGTQGWTHPGPQSWQGGGTLAWGVRLGNACALASAWPLPGPAVLWGQRSHRWLPWEPRVPGARGTTVCDCVAQRAEVAAAYPGEVTCWEGVSPCRVGAGVTPHVGVSSGSVLAPMPWAVRGCVVCGAELSVQRDRGAPAGSSVQGPCWPGSPCQSCGDQQQGSGPNTYGLGTLGEGSPQLQWAFGTSGVESRKYYSLSSC